MTERPFMPLDLAMRNDQKVGALEEENPAFVTLWIYLLCMMYEERGPLKANYKRLAYLLRFPSEEDVRHVVEDFDLFTIKNGYFWNKSAMERIELKDEAARQKREAGRAGGRSRNGGKSLEAPLEAPLEANKSINKSINKSSSAGAPAGEMDDEDFYFVEFFFRNFNDPKREAARCIKNYEGSEVKNRRNVANKWTPDDTSPRFDDPRILTWARTAYAIVGIAAGYKEAAEFLRHIDAISIDRGRNELKVRMLGKDFAEAAGGIVLDNAELQQGFAKVTVTKRTGS